MSLLAIDLGGTRLRAAWYDESRRQLARAETKTRADEGPDAVIERVIATGHQVVPAGEAPSAIGMSTPGPMDARRGVILHSFALPGWQDVPLASIVSQAFGGAPTFAENDGNVGPLAEYHLGAGRGANPMIYMTISTGIGGGVIIDGKLFTGWSGHAAEPGHMQFNDDQGQVRRLEELASGTALARLAMEKLATWPGETSLRDVQDIDGAMVGRAAQAGDALALSVVQTAGRYLGLALVNLLHLFSPQAVVVGGSVTQLGDLIFGPARAVITERVLDPAFVPPNFIRQAQLGDDVCLIGAALYAQQRRDAID
ncbi:MAG: ROK family protein [Anaerolineae bacterium]|nr:ROK family protein [Anaerolineae bacterium]